MQPIVIEPVVVILAAIVIALLFLGLGLLVPRPWRHGAEDQVKVIIPRPTPPEEEKPRELNFNIDTLLSGLRKFEDPQWVPPPRWSTSDRVAFIMVYLSKAKHPVSSQVVASAGKKAGDFAEDGAYNWWMRVLGAEGMVIRTSAHGERPTLWKITVNRQPLSVEQLRLGVER